LVKNSYQNTSFCIGNHYWLTMIIIPVSAYRSEVLHGNPRDVLRQGWRHATQHSWLINVLISTKKSTHRLISLGMCHSQWKNMETTVLSAHFCRWSCNLFKLPHCPKGSNNSNQVQLSFLKDLMMLVKWQNCSDCKDANKDTTKIRKR